MTDEIGALAASDSYDPFAAETFLPPGLKEWTEQAAPKDVGVIRGAMGSLADLATLPQRAIQNSQDAVYTGTYDPRVPVEAALTAMGGGIGGTGAKAGETALAAGYDPKLWHGVSSIKLPKPIDEMSSILRPINPAPETVISPARLQNSMLMPLMGDRSAAAAALERVNGFPLENPVALQGGHGYMANTPDMVWAAGKPVASGIAKVAQEGAKTGLPVHGVYTAMSERSVDFSHMVSDTLAEMAKHTKITPEGEAIFNDTMRKIAPDFPGVLSPNAAEYLRSAPGELRNVFAKTMDTGKMQKYGFPSVAEARVAVTDPRLLHEPTGASGLSIARMDPQGTLGPSGHATYDTGIAGDYVGGLPASVPKEIMWPDIVGPLSTHADAVAAARVAAGKTPFRPTEDYLMGRTPVGLPKLQEANQQWVDSVSKYLEDRGFTLGAGATDEKAAAAIQGIRAYHGSPHDFEKFDPNKIGTGEGAQMFGHGLYFAEHEPIARGYREKLAGESTPWSMQLGGNDAYKNRSAFDEPTIQGLNELHARLSIYKDPSNPAIAERLRKELAQTIENYQTGAIGMDKYGLSDAQAAQRVLGDPTFKVTPPITPGHMYEVNINADPKTMLDWDKPLRDQPIANRLPVSYLDATKKEAYVRALAATDRVRADQLWGMVKDPLNAPGGFGIEARRYIAAPETSAALNEAGIPGVKYLDAGSRASGEGTSNYVMFPGSADLIDIMRKYGIAAAPVGMGALAAQDQYSNQQ